MLITVERCSRRSSAAEAMMASPAAKSLGVLLNNAVWLGKGKQPTVGVIEPQCIEPAAKEKIPETIQANTQEESELPLAAESSEPIEEAAPFPAMPVLSKPLEVPIEMNGDEVTITQGDRRYRVLGLEKNTVIGILRLNVLVTRDERLHVDTFDLYSSRHRMMFSKQAGEELGVKEEVVSRDLGRMLWKIEELQRQRIQKTLEPKEQEVALSEEERAAALGLLRDPRLLDRILEDFERCGVVGEETNKLASYVAVVSRLLDAPLAILVQSSSAAGKSALMEAVLAMLPEEQRVQYSAMTGQSLFYMGETDLKHKVLGIASTGKDATTGRLITQHYRVEGPVMLFLTTTAIDLDEELLNRCLVLAVDEDRAQTQAIHKKQREAQTLEGLLARRERDETLRVHRNAQRLLKPLFVANPYARELTFLDSQTRTRRDHMKYLTLIRSIALLHQHQRPPKTVTHRGQALEYIEVTLDDIAIANRLAHEVLGRSLDELPPQTKRLLLLTDEMVSAECARQKMEREDFRFSRKDVRRFTKWSDSQLKRHLHRLEELEYLLLHHGGRGQTFAYELVFERQDDSGKPMLPGLIDVEKLTGYGYDAKKSGVEGEKSGPSLPQVRGVSGGGAGEESPVLARRNGEIGPHLEKITTRAARENRVVHTAAGVR